jgi:sulfide:quinone oxidoreductase
VTIGGDEIAADHLVVSLGADFDLQQIPGLAEAGHNFYTLAGAETFWGALQRMRTGRIVVLTAAPAYKCPAAPYEAAMLIDGWYRRQRLRDAVRIDVYAAEPGPMGVAGPEMSNAVRQLLESKGIAYHPAHQVTTVDAAERRLAFSNGARTAFDLLAFVPPHRPPAVIRESGMVSDTGWVAVDRHTLETRWPRVYAIGDVVAIPLALGKPLPKAGVFAHGEADVVARNIASTIAGTATPARFDGHGECFIETGDGKAGFGGGDFYAEPVPTVTLHSPSRRWHLGKVWFEKTWLHTQL